MTDLNSLVPPHEPAARGMRLFDPVTAKPRARAPKLAKKSLTIGPDSAENRKIIKHLSDVQY